MKSMIIKNNVVKEFYSQEKCFISEIYNNSEEKGLSIARVRVEPGVKTELHYLDGVDEKYLITEGKGKVNIGTLPPTNVKKGNLVIIPSGTSQQIKNIGDNDLIFYCICTPRFSPDCYNLSE